MNGDDAPGRAYSSTSEANLSMPWQALGNAIKVGQVAAACEADASAAAALSAAPAREPLRTASAAAYRE